MRFSASPKVTVRAPGRVNLIGEHTDYNEGFVFPAAIDRWVAVASRPREDDLAVVYSTSYNEEDRFSTTDEPSRVGTWADYVRGIVREFQLLGHRVPGFDAALAGDVPVGAGLSSSAAVEMAVGRTLLELADVPLSGPDLALLGQRAENRFVGVNCGIMDQFISANGRQAHALLLDCRDLSFELVALPGEDTRIVI
ncbi:MAG: galactokinase family protein, partial [Candidatus Latescibacteria bacterium]|nr:galactokinase family protein [Candidatus Latescibacterota bacterium]